MIKQLLAAAAALALAAPVAVQAQEVPSYAAAADQQIHGRVTAFDGAYNLQVRDDNGYVDNVELHDGTIINPTGLTLAPGMVVSILGDPNGPAFDANEIDTPYVFENAVPFYAGHPWDYYGPSFGLSFFFGNTGWWHGGYGGYHGAYGRNAYVRSDAGGRGVAFNAGRSTTTIVNNYDGAARESRLGPAQRSFPVERGTQRFGAPAGYANGNVAQHFSERATTSAPRYSASAPSRGSEGHGRR